jgi:hypothetical protein
MERQRSAIFRRAHEKAVPPISEGTAKESRFGTQLWTKPVLRIERQLI